MAKVVGVFLGWSAFAGTHLALSHPPIREDLIQKLGKDKFAAVYSAVALGTFVPTVYFYTKHAKGTGPLLWSGNGLLNRTLGLTFKAAGAVTFSQAIMAQSPIFVQAQPNSTSAPVQQDVEAKGIYRVSRHATFMSFALLGMGNLLTRGHLADVVYWGMFPAFWILGSLHQDERLKKSMPPSFFEKTSLLPFQAIYEGKQSIEDFKKEFNGEAAAIALFAPLFF